MDFASELEVHDLTLRGKHSTSVRSIFEKLKSEFKSDVNTIYAVLLDTKRFNYKPPLLHSRSRDIFFAHTRLLIYIFVYPDRESNADVIPMRARARRLRDFTRVQFFPFAGNWREQCELV